MSLCDHSFSLLNVTQIKDYGVMQSPGLHCRQNILKAKLKQLMPCRIEAVVKQKPWPSHREWLKYTLSNQRPISKCVFYAREHFRNGRADVKASPFGNCLTGATFTAQSPSPHRQLSRCVPPLCNSTSITRRSLTPRPPAAMGSQRYPRP